MLKEVLQKLDDWLEKENQERRTSGTTPLKCEVNVIGQTALLEARLGLSLAATMDVDLLKQIHGQIREKLDEFLAEHGKKIDPVGHEAWMPKETKFDQIYTGRWLVGSIAQPEYVLLSKAKMAPAKNKNLIAEYLGTEPSPLFLKLADKYAVDLEQFL